MLFKDFLDEIITGYENEGVIISLNELRSEELFISYNTKRVFVYDVSICEKYLKWSKSWVSSDHLEKWSNIQKFINHLFSRQRVKLFGAAEWFYLLSSYSRQKWIILVQDVIATASSMLTWIVEKEDLNNLHSIQLSGEYIAGASIKFKASNYSETILLQSIPNLRQFTIHFSCHYKKSIQQIFQTHQSTEIDENVIHMKSQWCALIKFLWSVNESGKKSFNCSLLRTLVIVLKANTKLTHINVPLDNVLLRHFFIISKNDWNI